VFFFHIGYNNGQISYTWRGKLNLSIGLSRRLAVIAALCFILLSTTALFAQEESAEERITAAERALPLGDDAAGAAIAPSPASALSILRVLLTLVVVAAAIYGLVYVVKRLARGGVSRDPFLKILASAPLGANRSAHIIAAGSQAWLVGAAENGVTLISEIGDKEFLDTLFLEDSRRNADAADAGGGSGGRFPDFKAMLRKLGVPMDASAPPSPENIHKRSERLKGL